MSDHPLLALTKTQAGEGLEPVWLSLGKDEAWHAGEPPSPEDTAAMILALGPEQGWIWRMGEPLWLDERAIAGDFDLSAPLIEAALLIGPGRTVELRHAGVNRWTKRTLTETTTAVDRAIAVLADDVEHLAAMGKREDREAGRRRFFKYRRYFAEGADGLMRIVAARFDGFVWRDEDGTEAEK